MDWHCTALLYMYVLSVIILVKAHLMQLLYMYNVCVQYLYPFKARLFYTCTVGDSSASDTSDQAAIDEIIDMQDPDVVDDLRHHNRGQVPKYDQFWEQCRKYLEESTTVDERRHDEVVHLAKAISARDLLEQVAAMCPEGTPVPSEQWLRLQFWPKNKTTKTALQYTGNLDIKFMVQARQTRKWHEDAHYCACLFRYLKEYAVMFKQYTNLVFKDDKHHCKVGEPGLPVAAVERGKQVVVSANGKRFSVADHDFTKCSIIPSVTVVCDIPNTIDESFYRGQVYVGVKDAIFEPSSGLRHSTELSKVISQSVSGKPVLLIYTDGGPDHNLTFAANQLALIALFRQLDLDVLQAVRTAPYHSWKNPCERVNCILNLGLQSVGLMREKMTPDLEDVMGR